MAESGWELQDVRLTRGEEPEILARHKMPEMAMGIARDELELRMKSHLKNGSQVDCVRIVNEDGEVALSVTASQLREQQENGNGSEPTRDE
jgi:hypothetical protein